MMKTLNLVLLFFVCYSQRIFVSGYSYSPDAEYVISIETSYKEKQTNFKEKFPKIYKIQTDSIVNNRYVRSLNRNNKKQTNFKGKFPKIEKMQTDIEVFNRYANSLITSDVQNYDSVPRETAFSVILPNTAFITEFKMVIDGETYTAYVIDKNRARNIYDQAIIKGSAAAHVAVTVRDSNRFTVSVNIEARSKATFFLKYEELLRLKDNQYELVVNIHPSQPVRNLLVNVHISDSKKLTNLTIPPLRSGIKISKIKGDLDPQAHITNFSSTVAMVRFEPTIERQKELAKNLGTDVSKGLSGQFVVQYDVERDSRGGEMLVKDGYFIHFFSPNELQALNKFVIFVLDTSGSMRGQKIEQLKKAMISILDQLHPKDYFHIVEFQTNTKIWNVHESKFSCSVHNTYRTPEQICHAYPKSTFVDPDNIERAKNIISNLRPRRRTNIYEALTVTMDLIEMEKFDFTRKYSLEPIVIFLTDGDPTVGTTNKDKIITDITKKNEDASIFSLSFGDGADKDFLNKLAQENKGFTQHIYESTDAALQLQNFYNKIASPLLSDVKFEYAPNAISLTKTKFPLYFDRSEIVVSGKLRDTTFLNVPQVTGTSTTGPITLQPTIKKSETSLERLWAYLTIQQLLDEKVIAKDKAANEEEALNLALRYSFVTPVSSLVVVKPNFKEDDIQTVPADKSPKTANSTPLPSIYTSSSNMPPNTPHITIPANIIGSDVVNKDFLLKKLDDLFLLLPWLRVSFHENGTFVSPSGGYELGIGKRLFYKKVCSITPAHTIGRCELLHECPQIYHLLTSEEVFVQYFCPIEKRYGKFAGVCCP